MHAEICPECKVIIKQYIGIGLDKRTIPAVVNESLTTALIKEEKIMHAEICPICKGTGKITTGRDSTTPIEKTCHGCNGKGWIEIHDRYNPILTYYPQIEPFPKPPWTVTWTSK